MANILWMMRKTCLNTFRRRMSWLILFFMPVVGVLISILLYSGTSSMPLRLGVVNMDGTEKQAEDTIHFLKGLNKVSLTLMEEKELNEKIAAGELDAGVLLAKGYSDALLAGDRSGLEIRSMKGAESTAFLKAMLEQYSGNLASIGAAVQGDREAFDQLHDRYRQQSFQVEQASVSADTTHSQDVTYQTFGFLILFMLFSATNMASLILEEKENRTYLRLMSSPLTARAYVLSNALVSLLVLLLQIVVTLFVMKELLGLDPGISTWKIVMVFTVFSLVAIGLALMLASLCKSSNSMISMQNLIVVPSCLLAGCFFPISVMPAALQKAAAFTPQHYILDALDRFQSGQSISGFGMNFAILFAFALVFVLAAIYRFGRNNDTRMFF
ncbi:ABC transporter permease [Gorillibacterium sp. CAU 1737]|uniref:ABC transporter permease n=1 Tax=Gorillibacterium sp. CAU 1737 TaxID=3140362 RepID=UPI00326065A2